MPGSKEGFDSMVDSLVGSIFEVSYEFDSMVGPGSTLSAGFVLGMQAYSNSAHSVTGEFVPPASLQSIEGKFQHYDHWMHSMCTSHEGNPSGNAKIPRRCSTGLIHDLVLLLSQILLLDL